MFSRSKKNNVPGNRAAQKTARKSRFQPHVEALADRIMPAVTASFAGNGVLTVFGDALNNNIAISPDAAGKTLVNGGANNVVGGTPTVANTSLMQVFDQAGNDTNSFNEANGTQHRGNHFDNSGKDLPAGNS